MSQPTSLQWKCARPLLTPLAAVFLFFSFLFNPAAHSQESQALEPGKPIERELAGGQAHSYQITLAVGQYLHVVVEQRGIDVVVVAFGPDGKQLVEVDSPNGTQGPEPVYLVTESGGNYRLSVQSPEKNAKPGRYEVKIEELRAATPQDRSRLAARKAFDDGERLRAQGTAQSRRQAIEKYQEALPHWRAIEARAEEARTLNSIGSVYNSMGELQKALDYYNQALPLRRAAADRYGEAVTLNNIGLAYDSLGQKQKALDHYNQALPLFRALGDSAKEEAQTLHNIGAVYYSMGERQKALDYYD